MESQKSLKISKTIGSDVIYLDKCAVCNEPASKACGSCELEYYCCKEHQKSDWERHKKNCSNYEVRKHDIFGFCMVATKSITAATILASEYPIAIYNKELDNEGKHLQNIFKICESFPFTCPSCELGKIIPGKIYRCSKCGITLCQSCESGSHRGIECQALQDLEMKESRGDSDVGKILADVTVLRVLLKEDKRGCPISFDNKKWRFLLKKVFNEKLSGDTDPNRPESMEILKSLKAVDSLPLSLRFSGNRELIILLHCALSSYGISMLNENRRRFLYTKNLWLTHSCSPNAEMWIDNHEKYYKLTIKATRVIRPGKRITVNKAGNLISLPTLERRKKLKKLFGIDCHCKRCRDPTELGSFVSAIRCEEHASSRGCFGHYLSKDPLNDKAVWKCTDSICKSFKSSADIQQIVRNAEKELPTVSGQADVVLKKLKAFIDYYSGDILYTQHFLIRIARIRMRQVAKYFLGSEEKQFLCVLNDYPRAYEYCTIRLASVESILFLVDKVNPLINETRGKLLYEKGCAELALSLYDYKVTRVKTITALVRKVEAALKTFKEAAVSISIYSHTAALKEKMNFFANLILKTFRGHLDSGSNPCPFSMNCSLELLERKLDQLEANWKTGSKEIGLVTFYMEPSSIEHPPSVQTLRSIIFSDIKL